MEATLMCHHVEEKQQNFRIHQLRTIKIYFIIGKYTYTAMLQTSRFKLVVLLGL